MKPKSCILGITALFLLSFNSFAQIVEPDYARKIVLKTFSELQKGSGAAIITGDSVIYDDSNQPLLYIFNESKGGFVIIAADRRSYPLLGWSDSGSLSPQNPGLPPALTAMIDDWKAQIIYCRTNDLIPGEKVTNMWNSLEKDDFEGFNGTKDIAPLLMTKWSQGCGYNALCPVDASGPCGRALTGCVATAMAQVIRYNMHPVKGTGSKCYTTYRYGELCAVFSDGTYDYAAMSNTSGNAAVAKLMSHCGISVSMNYGPSASSASSGSVASAMRTYFDYTNGMILSKSFYAEENWEALLRSEMEKGRVVYYSGFGSVGHAFVLDGWKETNYFHVDWGWGGSYNGYFYLNSLNPGGMTFNSGQQAIVGMIPVSQFTGLSFSSAIVLDCQTPFRGDLSAGVDYVNYYKNIYPATVGKELVYKFTTTIPGRIKIKISDQTEPVYTFLLNYADKDSLLAYGSNGVVVDNTAPGTFYVVVESQGYSEPSFTIEAVCPTLDADLDITAASVVPKFIQSLQTNVMFSSTVRNIGRTSSPACQMEYFLSEDTKFDFGKDRLIGTKTIPPLDPGNSSEINSVCSLPDSLMPCSCNIIFMADRLNDVPETDEENIYAVYVSVPDSGILNCSSSLALSGGKWYYGNTMKDGKSKVEKYSMATEMTGPEVVHTFVSAYNGLVKISFVDRCPGVLFAILLPVCNEFTGEQPLRVPNITDTLVTDYFYAVAGSTYYVVVDGSKGASGDYGLRVDLPEKCPETTVSYWGSLDICDGDSWPGLQANTGHSFYQWFRNGAPVRGANYNYYNPSSEGNYHVEIAENGCRAASEILTIRSDPRPDTAHIAIADTAIFCPGGSVLLSLENSVSFPVNWALDEFLIPGATSDTYPAAKTGSYSLYAVNGACKVKSDNTINVTVLEPPADLRDTLPFPSDMIRFFCPFNTGGYENHTGGGTIESATMIGWDYEPIDDRFGNFWKARYLMGADEYMYWPDFDTISDDFTLALWFKTTTHAGGVITGFYDSPWKPTKTEAVLYMSDNGKLHFWLSNTETPEEISTASSYNDGKWHFVMIEYADSMTLVLDDRVEKITLPGPFKTERFPGYWTFGGVYLPASVTVKPTSVYFMGAIDDILCLDETNKYTIQYSFREPVVKISLTEPLPECIPSRVNFSMPFGQRGVEYRVWDRVRSQWSPSAAFSDGGSVRFGDAEVYIGNNELQILATNLVTGCETVLDTVIVFNVLSVCTDQEEIPAGSGLKVFPVPAKDILYFESERDISEMTILDSAGKIILISRPECAKFEVNLNGFPASVYFYRLKTSDNRLLRGRFIVR